MDGKASAAGGDARAELRTEIKHRLPACNGLPREMLETGLSEHVFERMNFLWRASHHLRISSPAASRIFSDQLRKLAEEQHGSTGCLPEWIRESMCSSCGSVLTPGVNCRVRVRHRSLSSPSVTNLKKNTLATGAKRPKKPRNEVVVTCALCDGVNARGGTERRAHHNKRCKGGGGAGAEEGSSATPASKHSQGFRRTADKLRGNFIPLGKSAGISTGSSTINDQQRKHRSKMDQRKRTPAKAKHLSPCATPGECREASPTNFTIERPETPHATATPGKGVRPREVMIPLCVRATPSAPSSHMDEVTNGSGSDQALSLVSGGGSSRQDGAGKQRHDANDLLVSNTLPPVLWPSSLPGEQGSTDGCSVSHGGSLRTGDDGGNVSGKSVGEAEPQFSLLEKIRRDAKKKRRKAAAVSASPGAIR